MPSRLIRRVRPGTVVVVISQPRIAKKKPAVAISVMMAKGELRSAVVLVPDNWCIARSSLGVIAFCLFGAGSELE